MNIRLTEERGCYFKAYKLQHLMTKFYSEFKLLQVKQFTGPGIQNLTTENKAGGLPMVPTG